MLQILKSGHLEPPFSSDPPHGLLPRLNTFTPITVAPRTQSTSFYQETRKSNTDSRQKPTRKSPGRSYKEHRRSKSSEHTQFQPIPEAPFTQRSTSPLYLVQTNVTGGARGYGHSSLRDGQSHVSDGGLWNLGSGPSFLHRHSPQVSALPILLSNDLTNSVVYTPLKPSHKFQVIPCYIRKYCLRDYCPIYLAIRKLYFEVYFL